MNTKKTIALISAAALICSSAPFQTVSLKNNITAAASEADKDIPEEKARIIGFGHGGGSTSWELTDDGTLTINGSGDMYDFPEPSVCPWLRERNYHPIRKIVIEEGITSISSYAFYGCDEAEQIIIPDSVTSIGREAFSGCSMIKELTIPDSVKTIGNEAFEMENLEVLELGSPDVIIGKLGKTFKSSPYYTKLLKEQKADDKITFLTAGNTLIDIITADTVEDLPEKITIPDNISSVAGGCFENKKIKSVILPESLKYISDSSFEGSTLAELVIPESVEYIGDSAFRKCKSLSEVTLPSSLEYIAAYAFAGCENIKEINIPENVKSISNHAFSDCSGIESIKFEGSPEVIGNYAFRSCTSLTDISLSVKDAELGGYVFSDCTNLKSAKISGSLKTLPDNAFLKCTSLSSVILPENLQELDVHAFSECSSLKEIEIPSSVNYIGYGAFSDTAISSVILPDSLTQISPEIFKNCPELTFIRIPSSVEKIADNFIDEDQKITIKGMKYSAAHEMAILKKSEFISEGESEYTSGYCGPGDEYWKLDDDGTLTITGEGAIIGDMVSAMLDLYSSTLIRDPASVDFSFLTRYPELDLMHRIKKIEIESPIEELDTTSVSFADSTLESVKLPKTLKKIKSDSFKDCKSLKSVLLPDSTAEIENGAFDGCTSLEETEFYKSENIVSEESEQLARLWHMPAVKGDINGNNSVDASDLLLFSKWMLEGSETRMINRSGAMVTNDKTINIADFVALKDLIINEK